jgi:hypothetical protein
MIEYAHDRKPRTDAGWTLVELAFIMTVAGVLAATAVPQFARARLASVQASTIGSLKAIHGAQTAYAQSCGGGFYAPSIVWLARPAVAGGVRFIGPEFTSNTTDRYAYRIQFSAGPRVGRAPRTCNGLGPGRAVSGYFVEAYPQQVPRGTVGRYFGVNASGTIYESTKRVRPIFSGEPPAPARPID